MAPAKTWVAALLSLTALAPAAAVRKSQDVMETSRCNKMSAFGLCNKNRKNIVEGMLGLTGGDFTCIQNLCHGRGLPANQKCCNMIDYLQDELKSHKRETAHKTLIIPEEKVKMLFDFAFADADSLEAATTTKKPTPTASAVESFNGTTSSGISSVPKGCNKMSNRFLCNKSPDHVVSQLSGMNTLDLDCISATCDGLLKVKSTAQAKCCKVKSDVKAALHKTTIGIDEANLQRLLKFAAR